MIKWRDFLLFAAVMFVSAFVTGFIQGLIPGFLENLGVAGTIIVYLITVYPTYWLLNKFWRRRRAEA